MISKTLVKAAKEWVPAIAIALVLSLTIRTYVANASIVPTGSMIPTIQINDRIIVDKMINKDDLKFDDVVVFYPPIDNPDHKQFVKRLIGLGGDTIEIKNGFLYRNGMQINEPYISAPMDYRFGPVQVPKDQFFFLGDNRNNSDDAHLWPMPFVNKDQIVGKAVYKFYPVNHMGAL